MEECNIVNEGKEHGFDVVAVECRCLIVLHLVFVEQLRQLLLIAVPA